MDDWYVDWRHRLSLRIQSWPFYASQQCRTAAWLDRSSYGSRAAEWSRGRVCQHALCRSSCLYKASMAGLHRAEVQNDHGAERCLALDVYHIRLRRGLAQEHDGRDGLDG